MLVWRYMDFKYGLKSVMEARFKIASPFSLNDSFEMLGTVTGTLSVAVKRQMLESLHSRRETEPAVSPHGFEKQSWKQVVSAIENDSSECLRQIILRRQSQEERSRVLCFSKYQQEWDDRELLLWSHCADGGRGVRVLIDLDKDETSYHVGSVNYTNRRPVLDLSRFKSWIDQDVFRPFFYDSIFSKSLIWSYEREVRVFATSSSRSRRYSQEGGLEFLSFDPSQIKCVDFGPMGMIEHSRDATSAIHSNESLKHVVCRIATFGECEYKYDYQQLLP